MEKSLSRAKAPQKNSTREREKQARETRSAAERNWDFSWDQFFPFVSEELGVTFDLITFEEFQEFAGAHFKEAFDFSISNDFTRAKNSVPRERYLKNDADFFGIFGAGELIGVALASATDWTSYHLRNLTILPEYQGSGLGPVFIGRLLETLRSVGAMKLEAYTSPGNYKSFGALFRHGAIPVGYENSDQWGALVKTVIFLNETNVASFLSAISAYSREAHRASSKR